MANYRFRLGSLKGNGSPRWLLVYDVLWIVVVGQNQTIDTVISCPYDTWLSPFLIIEDPQKGLGQLLKVHHVHSLVTFLRQYIPH